MPSAGRVLDGATLAPFPTADSAGVEPGVVRIDATLQFQNAIGAGTGVVLSQDGIVLTNNHIIRAADDELTGSARNSRT